MLHFKSFLLVDNTESSGCLEAVLRSVGMFRDFRILYFSSFALWRFSKNAVSGIILVVFKTKSDYKSFGFIPNPTDVRSSRPPSFFDHPFWSWLQPTPKQRARARTHLLHISGFIASRLRVHCIHWFVKLLRLSNPSIFPSVSQAHDGLFRTFLRSSCGVWVQLWFSDSLGYMSLLQFVLRFEPVSNGLLGPRDSGGVSDLFQVTRDHFAISSFVLLFLLILHGLRSIWFHPNRP